MRLISLLLLFVIVTSSIQEGSRGGLEGEGAVPHLSEGGVPALTTIDLLCDPVQQAPVQSPFLLSAEPVCAPLEGMAQWCDLAEDKQLYYGKLGWNQERWDSTPDDREMSFQEFNPQKVRLSIPALEQIDFDFLAMLLASHQVELRGGTLVGDDEFAPREYMPMREYLDQVRNGLTHNYLKYDPEDELWKESIDKGLGVGVLSSLLDALDQAGLLTFKLCEGYSSSRAWTFWVGAADTFTGMHYDDDEFGFLYVTTGRKRIVLLPNDERTANYTCKTYIEGHSCWTGIDILNGPLPPHAVEFELGPGEGMIIPTLAWHAVKNLEPTIAFGVLVSEEDYC